MKNIVFGIFAHPDDEAMGPSGALLKATKEGAELHLITLTDGSAGTNPDGLEDLGGERLKEWREAGKLIGATTMHHLGYVDGELGNNNMIEASTHMQEIITAILQEAPEDAEVTFITLDLNGYTGHIDHIVAARAACFVYYSLKKHDTRLNAIKFACVPERLSPKVNIDWIYMEPGRSPEEISEIVDARNLRDELLDIIRIHRTQRADGDFIIKSQGDDLGLISFIVRR